MEGKEKLQQAVSFYRSGQLDKSRETCLDILKSQPDHFDSLHFLAIINYRLGDYQNSVDLINQAIALSPNNANFYSDRGVFFKSFKKLELALSSYDKAIEISPNRADYHYNRANLLSDLRELNKAILSYNTAIELDPNNANYYSNLANVFKEMMQPDLALTNYNKALQINPNYVEAYYNLGHIFAELKKPDLALINYQKAFQLSPNQKFLPGLILYTKSKICDWSSYDQSIVDMEERILRNELAISPFAILAIKDSLSLQYAVAKIAAEADYPEINNFGPIPKRLKGDKIRIGYYSADFHNHPVAYLSSDLFASHDRSKFELIGFSFGPDIDDEMRRKVKGSFDQFIDVRLKSDLEVTKLSRDMGIDIAVDLHGFTQNMRLNIFAARCAPIQVNYIGYPGTMGASYMDYLMTDKVMVPTKSYGHYSEKIVSLPDIYLVNCNRAMSDKVFTREEFGLPNDGFVYCCFNNSHKITPAVFDVWMRILKSVEGSVLWLFVDNAVAIANLRKEAERRGVSADRIIIADRLPMPEHLARHKLADLFLDTLPYTAHTTCSDALWAGLPVLTLIGESYPARVSAAILNSMGLPDLITNTQEEYEFKAIEFGNDADKLWEIRERLSKNKLTSPVYDVKKMTKSVEAAYEAMYDRYCNDLLPDNIEIKN
jgi:protein O-GlcNAc transferase